MAEEKVGGFLATLTPEQRERALAHRGEDSFGRQTKNTIVAIGYLGWMRCYLNVPKEEAIKRYIKSENIDDLDDSHTVKEFDVSQEFEAYDVWGVVEE